MDLTGHRSFGLPYMNEIKFMWQRLIDFLSNTALT